MTEMKRWLAACSLAALVAVPALAHDGHHHDEDTAATTPTEVGPVPETAGKLPQSQVTIEVRDGIRYIRSNGIPNHKTGSFPNRNNPNSITEQSHNYQMPAEPRMADRSQSAAGKPFGIALNGVVFDPGTAEFWNNDRRGGWNYEALSGKINLGVDTSNAHVQPTGAYHYHGMPDGLIKALNGKRNRMTLVGYAADGFPIYAAYAHSDARDAKSPVKKMTSSWRLKSGNRPADGPSGKYDGTFSADYEYVEDLGDLDECNGRFGVTPEYPDGIYYYVLTDEFPHIPRYFRGTPDSSFDRHGGGGGPGGQGGPGGGGPGGMGGPGGGGPPGGDQGGRRPPPPRR